jgi:heme-degrading monooxygenase HmoA
MIARLWRGWTSPEQADEYERLLWTEIFPGIAAKRVAGFEGIELFRRTAGEEVEFLTLMRFSSWAAVRAFAGDDYERAYVPASARRVLKRFDERSAHYEVRT